MGIVNKLGEIIYMAGRVNRKTGYLVKSWLPSAKEIGDRLTKAQGSRPDTLIEELSEVSGSVIGRCKKGEHIPNLNLLCYYAVVEGFSLDWLILGKKAKGDPETFEVWLAKALNLSLDQRLRLQTALASSIQASVAALSPESRSLNGQAGFQESGNN